MKSMARSAKAGCSAKRPPMTQARPIQRPRQPPTTSPKPGTEPMGSRLWFPIARTIMDPISFPEKLIPLMVLSALHGEQMPVYGNGLNVRDWLFVDDHARALGLILSKGEAGRDL